MKIQLLVLQLFVITLFSSSAMAHVRAKVAGNLVPRSNSDNLKTAPCGGIARGITSAAFSPGQTITMNWEETINHPGRFEIYFSAAGDSNWQLLKTVIDTTDNTNDLPHQYSTTVTLPSTPCSACTIQLIQVMTENPAAPTYYYSCFDVRTQAASSTPAPAPTPRSNPCE